MDIFSINELLLVAFVALLVIGPSRLPETLRTLGLWIGRLSRSFNSVKAEIEKEIGMDEIRRQLHNESVMEEMKRIEREVKRSIPQDTPGQDPSQGASAAPFENDIAPPPLTDETLPERAVDQAVDEAHEQNAEAADNPATDTPPTSEPATAASAEDASEAEPDNPAPEPTVRPRSEAELEALHARRLKKAAKASSADRS